MQKLERLLNLAAALLETPRPLTVEDIHERVAGYPPDGDSFRRAFERDKDDLRELGIPIELTVLSGDANNVGYRIPPDQYYLEDPGLTPDEVAALQLALSAVHVRMSDRSDPASRDLLRKLGGAPLGEPDADPIAEVPAPEAAIVLLGAIVSRSRVYFDYGSATREVDPWRLDFQRGRWYLSGFDHLRDAERHFRLDRFGGPVSVGPAGSFDRPEHTPGVRLTPWELGDAPVVQARVRFDASHVEMAVAEVDPASSWERHEDGSATVELTVANPDALRTWVLGYLDHAVVESPPELRQNIADWLDLLVRTTS